MNKRNFVLTMLGVLVITAVVIFGALLLPSEAVEAKTKSVVGSWEMEVSTPGQGSFPALISLTGDGVVVADEVPAPFETTGHGNWVSTGDYQVKYAFLAYYGTPEQKLSARLKVSGVFNYNPQTDKISGPFKIVIVEPDGNILFQDEGTMTGARIPIEP